MARQERGAVDKIRWTTRVKGGSRGVLGQRQWTAYGSLSRCGREQEAKERWRTRPVESARRVCDEVVKNDQLEMYVGILQYIDLLALRAERGVTSATPA